MKGHSSSTQLTNKKKGGGANLPLFEPKSKTRMILAHKRVKALKFGKAVAYVENNMEL